MVERNEKKTSDKSTSATENNFAGERSMECKQNKGV
jgi:hypothetical protein